MPPLTTTLNRIRAHSPCSTGWTKLLASLGKTQADDEPLTFADIARSNGIDDALWCCRAESEQSKTWRLFAVWCARQVEHLMTNPLSKSTLVVAERHANGEATDDELYAARDAVGDAARDAARDAASAAARAAARAAASAAAGDAAGDAVGAAARDAARAAASAAARAAARAATRAATRDAVGVAARAAARDAAGDAARAAARAAQIKMFIEMVGE